MKFINANKFFNRYLPLGLSVILLATAGFFWEVSTARASYTYTRSITLQSSQIPANQSNFTVLVCANVTLGNGNACPTVSGLNQTGGGAHVQNSSGYDITFWTSSNCTGAMNWEMEKYVASTGEMEAWVLIPSLSTSGNTIYMCYGNSGISSFQGGSSGNVWNSNYAAVYHLPNGTSLGLNDSTSNGVSAFNNGGTAASGQIDGGLSIVNSTPTYVSIASSSAVTTAFRNTGWSISLWYKSPTTVTPSSLFAVAPHADEAPEIYLDSTGICGAGMAIIADLETCVISSITIPTANVWHYVVLTWSHANSNTATIYIDGSSKGTGTWASWYNGPVASSAVFAMGGDNNYGNSITGDEDEVRVNNTPLSANWITTEYNNQLAPGTFEAFGSETNNNPSANYTRISIQNMRASIQNARVSVIGN